MGKNHRTQINHTYAQSFGEGKSNRKILIAHLIKASVVNLHKRRNTLLSQKVSRERYKYEAGANNMSTVENPQQEFSLLEKGKKGKRKKNKFFTSSFLIKC